MANNAKFVFVDDPLSREIPIAFAGKMVLTQTPGTDPDVCSVFFHDDFKATYDAAIAAVKAVPKQYVQVKIVLETDDGVNPAVTAEWDGWYIGRCVPDGEIKDIWVLEIFDARELMRNGGLSFKANVLLENGRVDTDAKSPLFADWTVEDFITYVVEELLDQVGKTITIVNHELSNDSITKLSEVFPWNLGNMEEGAGWVAGKYDELIKIVEKNYGITIVPLIDGTIGITDRVKTRNDVRDLSSDHGGLSTEGSFYSSQDNSTVLPKEVDVYFPAKREFAAELPPSGTTPPIQAGLRLRQVLRKPQDILNPTSTDFEWVNIDDWISHIANSYAPGELPAAMVSNVDEYVAKNFLKENIVPPKLDPVTKLGNTVIEYLNGELAGGWRRYFQIEYDNAYLQQRYSHVRIGRLDDDGGTKAGGMVFSDWTIRLRKAWAKTTQNPGVLSIVGAEYSRSYRLVDWESQPARLRAFWVDPKKMVIGIESDAVNNFIAKGCMPGYMSKPITAGNYIELRTETDEIDGTESTRFVRTQQYGEFSKNLALRVILNGTCLINDKRYHKITKTAFGSSGFVNKIAIHVPSVFAIFTFTNAELASNPTNGLADVFATTLKNGTDLDEIASRITEEVKASFVQGNLGAIKHGGVENIVVQAGGECNQLRVEIGWETPFSFTSNWSVKPGEIIITLPRKKLDGTPIRIAI